MPVLLGCGQRGETLILGCVGHVPVQEDSVVDSAEFARWREAAEGARRAAELQAGGELHNWACFLAEQAAQLAVKGLLHAMGAGAWGHDLVALGRAWEESTTGKLPEKLTGALQRLSRHYIPPRYPDAHPAGAPGEHYGRQDVEQAMAELGLVLEQVDSAYARLCAAAGEAERER